MSLIPERTVFLHRDAIKQINHETLIRQEKRRFFKSLFYASAAGLSTGGLGYAFLQDEPTANDAYGKKVSFGWLSGLAALGTGALTLFFGYSANRSAATLQEVKGGLILESEKALYDLRCLKYMSEKERTEIVQKYHSCSFEDAKALLLKFEAQELDRDAQRKKNAEVGAKIRKELHAGRHKPFYPPRENEPKDLG